MGGAPAAAGGGAGNGSPTVAQQPAALQTHPLGRPPARALQLVGVVTQGGRLAVPPPEELPGADRLAPHLLGEYVGLMQRCWAQSPLDRPDFKEVAERLRWVGRGVLAVAAGAAGGK